jgi:hypothetical protein
VFESSVSVGRRFPGPGLIATALCSFALIALASSAVRLEPAGDITVEDNFASIPIWSGGAVVGIEDMPSPLPHIRIAGSDGKQLAIVPVKIPEADWVEVNGAACGPNGSFAVGGLAREPGARAAGFLALGSGGAIRKVIRTEPYHPTGVTISPDGTIWTSGVEVEPIKRSPTTTDHGVLRHFDTSGVLLAEFLPQSAIPRGEPYRGLNYLASNSNRLGWYIGDSTYGYFELADGKVERYPAVNRASTGGHVSVLGLTITDANDVFVTRVVNGSNPQLYMLDRTAQRWDPVPLPQGTPAATGWLLGGMGDILVFRTVEGTSRLRRFQVRHP